MIWAKDLLLVITMVVVCIAAGVIIEIAEQRR
jgi:hypothetical protein